MRCPCCLKDLIITHRERYQDLSEHVSNPNGLPSMKDGYQCTDEYCVANNLNCTWIEDGGIYIDPPEGVKWTVAHRIIEKSSTTGMYYALDSWEHYYNLGKKKIEKRTLLLNFHFFKVKIFPKDKGWDYPMETRHNPSLFRYKVEYWKRDKANGHYIMVIPISRMVVFCIKNFNRNFSRWKETGDLNSSKDALNEALCISPWGAKDERLYAKISSFIIQLIYPRKVKALLIQGTENKSQ